MRRILLSLMAIAILVTSLAFAQVGPKQKAKPKPKKKKTEEKSNLQPGERLQADTTDTKQKIKPKPAEVNIPEVKKPDIKSPAVVSPDVTNRQVEKTAVVPSNHLKRVIFTTGIVQREPVDDVDSLSTDVAHIYLFTEVAGLQDKTIRHRWIYDSKIRMELPIAIGGPNWRVYSRKKLPPEWTGEWTVLVVDEDENVLRKKEFVYYATHTTE